MSMQNPGIGLTVHYKPLGVDACRAAIITEVWYSDPALTEPSGEVALAVLNPAGFEFVDRAEFSSGEETPGNPNCPNPHGDGPFRYCACGWIEAGHKSGTWHWPEPVG